MSQRGDGVARGEKDRERERERARECRKADGEREEIEFGWVWNT
jgi:hypothetical protein